MLQFTKGRAILGGIGGVALAGAMVSPAHAAGANISPSTQTRMSGSLFTWTISWNGASSAVFTSGDGSMWQYSTGSGSRTVSDALLAPCGASRTYTQALTARSGGTVVASATSRATSLPGAC